MVERSASVRGFCIVAGASWAAAGGALEPDEHPASGEGDEHAADSPDAWQSSPWLTRATDAAFERDRRPLQVGLGVEQPRAAVDQTPTHVEQRKQRNLAGLIRALGLPLFDFERRNDLVTPRGDGLLGLPHPDGR